MSSCDIWQPWKLRLGAYVALSEHVLCYSVDFITIGNNVTISRDAFLCCASHDISSPNMELTHAPIEIGDNAWVYALAPIEIGSRCCVGEDVRLLTGSHDVQSPNFTLVTKPIVIKDNVWVATGATILLGVTIGEGAVVGCAAVATKDVEPWTVVGGNPAKFIKKRELKGE